jgi:uncharacterized protein YndB with AHSA1/START domain
MEIEREIVIDASRAEVWSALTEAERLEDWFATEVELDLREGGSCVFRWANGEERRGHVEAAEPEQRLRLRWEDKGAVELSLEEAETGTRVHVRETSPEWSTALSLQALAACPIA